MAATPAATPKEVSAILTKQGIEVSPNYVSTVKGKMAAKRGSGNVVSKQRKSPPSRPASAFPKSRRRSDC